MTEERYFEQLYKRVWDADYQNYSALLRQLYETEFRYSLKRDGNRAADGVDLRRRYRFYSDKPCNVLEMMIALAVRCEESVMTNSGFGDRTSRWFWLMITNLGLWTMTDEFYNRQRVRDILDIFMDRRYAPNGEGGLFALPYCGKDLRDVDIWYQAMWYFAEIE